MIQTMCQRCGYCPCACPPVGRIDPPPQPWICPRCGKVHGPASMTCDCKPAAPSEPRP